MSRLCENCDWDMSMDLEPGTCPVCAYRSELSKAKALVREAYFVGESSVTWGIAFTDDWQERARKLIGVINDN